MLLFFILYYHLASYCFICFWLLENIYYFKESLITSPFFSFFFWSWVICRTNKKNLAVALALYNSYLKLSSSWLVKDFSLSQVKNSMIIHYDGPKTSCKESINGTASEYSHGNVWTRYLPSTSDRILGS